MHGFEFLISVGNLRFQGTGLLEFSLKISGLEFFGREGVITKGDGGRMDLQLLLNRMEL